MTRIHIQDSFSFYRATQCGDRWIPFDAPISPTRGEAAGFALAAFALIGLFALALGS